MSRSTRGLASSASGGRARSSAKTAPNRASRIKLLQAALTGRPCQVKPGRR